MNFVRMQSSPIFSGKGSLYLICDGEACATRGIGREDFTKGAIAGGTRIMQYRHKNISVETYAAHLEPLAKLCHAAGVTLIVNDHAAVAEKFLLPLHLGQEDVLPAELRVPYGRSTHSPFELQTALEAEPPPDYLALGTMFPSPTKPEVGRARDWISMCLNRAEQPLVLIGGITLDNVRELPGGERIFYAVIGDAFRFGATPAGIEKYAKAWRS